MRTRELILTQLDAVRLSRVLDAQADRELAERIEAADVVPGDRIAADVVTMSSRVTLAPLPSGDERTVTLAYPGDVGAGAERVSVLSPLGRALLGARRGDEIDASLPDGTRRRYLIVAIPYQPEAAGDYLT
jgi:regulator of nucleoside diphosphate kinase